MPHELRHGRRHRLRLPQQFQRCFTQGQRVNGRCFRLHVLAAEGDSRLGLAVSRKVDPRAVGRNRIKRQARESFRLQRNTLPIGDYVLVARREAASASATELRADLDALWRGAGRLKRAAMAGTMRDACPSDAQIPRDS